MRRASLSAKMIKAVGLAALIVPAAGAGAAAAPLSTYVLLGEDGRPVIRAIVEGDLCPTLRLDDRRVAMSVRVGEATVPPRRASSEDGASKSAAFPVSVCEAVVAKGAHRALIDGVRLPMPKRSLRRIVVIGDTGCRIKASDKAAQACSDPRRYPFAQIAAAAAAWKPDLVVHVGDYLYRETPCPTGETGCAGSPWGYGWDAWRADFFDPAAPLLKGAPLALARGNHETCERAGQGWARFLDTTAFAQDRACDDPAKDGVGNYSRPYAIPLGDRTQLIMFDSANTPGKALSPQDPRAVAYNQDYDEISRLSARTAHSLLVNHHPVLGFAAKAGADGRPVLAPGNLGLQSVLLRKAELFPPGVDVLLSGHVHVWEQLSFKGSIPSQFVAGFSGTEEDIVPLPAEIPADQTPAPGAVVEAFSSWVDGFGYMTMERTAPARWSVQVRDVSGHVIGRCRIVGKQSRCDRRQFGRASAAGG